MRRRWSILSALLATALVLWCTPGLFARHLSHTGRTDDRLKPEPSRVLVVWATSWPQEGSKLISSLCAAFEKQNSGIRVYLRFADIDELTQPGTVRPDVLLHTTGDVLSPPDVLVPLALPAGFSEQAASSGMSGGALYGVPLWYSPLVLSVPAAWVAGESAAPLPVGEASYFAAATPAPLAQENQLSLDTLPWNKLLDNGCIVAENGVGLTRLLLCCPPALRQQMGELRPVLRMPETGEAAVCTATAHLRRQDAVCLPLSPPSGQQARYASLCRDGQDAQAFLRFLLSPQAMEIAEAAGLAPVAGGGETAFLPNAFGMAQANIDEVCIQHFLAGDDPVSTLLRLR